MDGEDGPEPDAAKKAPEDGDPRRKKLADLGYDMSILDTDPQLAEVALASAILQEEKE
jgi:hypothetical protein